MTGNNAAKMVASTRYQVSLIFPSKVQSVGINAAKQGSVMATIDEYDGRVVYIDALKAGGTATLNFRILSETEEEIEKNGQTSASKGNEVREPVILKMLVDLTEKDSGVLSYTIRGRAPVIAAAPAPAPTPAPVATPKPSTSPVPVRPATVTAPVRPAPVQPTSFTGSNGSLTLTVKVKDTKGQNQVLSYSLALTNPKDRRIYTVDTASTVLRVKNVPISDLIIPKGKFPLLVSAPVNGTVEIPKRLQDETGAKVLMFTVLEKDTVTLTERRLYVGVILK